MKADSSIVVWYREPFHEDVKKEWTRNAALGRPEVVSPSTGDASLENHSGGASVKERAQSGERRPMIPP